MITLPTPRTDAVAKKIGSLACQWKVGELDAVQFEHAAQAEMDKLGSLERELTEAKAERDALDGMNKSLATMLRAYSVDPSRISNTEIAMARVALDERSADLADLTRWRSLAEELAEALKEANGSFCGSPQSQLRIDKALARFRDAANPASGAAITPEIHRKEEEANASRLKFLQAEGWCWTNEQIDRYRQIVRERRNDPTL